MLFTLSMMHHIRHFVCLYSYANMLKLQMRINSAPFWWSFGYEIRFICQKNRKNSCMCHLFYRKNKWKYEIILTRVGSTSHRFLLCVLYSDSTHESYKHLNRLVCTMCTIFYLYNLVKSWNIVNAHQICSELVIICIWYKIFLSTEMQKSFGRTVFFLLSQIWRKHNKSPNTG